MATVHSQAKEKTVSRMTRPLLTEADLYITHGTPLRLRDIMDITTLSRNSLRAEMERGALVGYRIINRPGSCWLFKRETVLAWWLGKQRNRVAC